MAPDTPLTEDEELTLRRHFRRGMLTDQAARLIQQAVADLINHPGWNEDRVKEWIEREKSAISGRNRLEEVSILADALGWAVRNPNPDPHDPKSIYSWPEPAHDSNDHLQLQLNGPFPHSLPSATSPYYSPLPAADKDGGPSSGGPPYGDIGIYGEMTRSPDPNSSLYSSTAKYHDQHHLDPSAQILLDNLTSFGRASVQPGHAVNDAGPLEHGAVGSNHFAGLLEAVTTAAGQEASQNRLGESLSVSNGKSQTRRPLQQPEATEYRTLKADMFSKSNKRKRSPTEDQSAMHNDTQEAQEQLEVFEPPPFLTTRRGRRSSRLNAGSDDDQFGQIPREMDQSGAADDFSTLEFRELPPQLVISDARAAGVHSAAALFRRPSASSRKYTRPPMSKLFTSLELSPENFLQLQAAAKIYMLDSAHPERQNCVGNRGKGDTDMVKLRLYNCVKEFLEAEGHGERYFGEHATNEGTVARKLIWPTQKNKIIGLVTPLLRRMVTNERQRQYAVETRKGGSEAKKRKADEMQSGSEREDVPKTPLEQLTREQSIDPKLNLSEDYLGHFKDPAVARQISNLGFLSGLADAVWSDLVYKVDAHMRNHELPGRQMEAVACDEACFEHNIWGQYFLQGGHMIERGWRNEIRFDDGEKLEFARSILKDLCNAIKISVMTDNGEADLHNSKRQKTSSENYLTKSLAQYHGQMIPRLENLETLDQTLERLIGRPSHELLQRVASVKPIQLKVHILHRNRKLRPVLGLSSDHYYDFDSLSNIIKDQIRDLGYGRDSHYQARVHLPNGLSLICSTAEFILAIMDAVHTSWMDGELKVIVEL